MFAKRPSFPTQFALVSMLTILTLANKTFAQEADGNASEWNNTAVIGPDPLPPTATGPASGGALSDPTPSQIASPGFFSSVVSTEGPINIAASVDADIVETSMPEFSVEPTEEAHASPMMYGSVLPQPSAKMSPAVWPTWTSESMPSGEVYRPEEESMMPWKEPSLAPSGETFDDYEPSMSMSPEEEPFYTPMQSPWVTPEPSVSLMPSLTIPTSVSAIPSESMMTPFMSETPSMSSASSMSMTPSASMSEALAPMSVSATPSMSMEATTTPSPSSTAVMLMTISPEPFSTPDSEPPKCRQRFTNERDMRCVASSKTIRRDDVIRFRVETQQEFRSIRTTFMVWGDREIRKYAIAVDMGEEWSSEKKTVEDFGDSVITVDRRNSSGKPIKVTMISHTADVDGVSVPEGRRTCCGMRYRVVAYMLICKGRTMEGCRDVVTTRIRKIKCWNACFENPEGRVTQMSKRMRCSRCDEDDDES